MTVTKRSSGSDLLVTLAGPARIQDMVDAADEFRQVFATPEPLVTVDLSGIETADVTFFQALLALQKSLAQTNRHLLVRKLPADHVVVEASFLLGIRLDHHFNQVGDAE